MADNVQEAPVWAVNSSGEILFQQGTGDNVVAGFLAANLIPTDTTTGKVVAKLPITPPVANFVVPVANTLAYLSKKRSDAKLELLKKPLIQAPLWATGVVVTLGMKRRFSNGQLMQCMVAGTTGGSEPTFSATTLIVDNTASWIFTGLKSKVNTDGYQVPAVTVDNNMPSTGVVSASFATNVMTVLSVTSGVIAAGDIITATNVTAGTFVSSLGTGTGGIGTYNLSTSPGTLGSRTASANLATERLLYSNTFPGMPWSGSRVGGSGYTDGVYTNVPLSGGTGTGAIANSITVSGGVVTAVAYPVVGTGSGYVYGDVLSANAANIGGTGSGFTSTVNQLWHDPALFTFVAQPDCVKIGTFQNAYSIALIVNQGGSTAPTNYGMRTIEFVSDEPFISFTTFNASPSPANVWVDGYLIEEDTTPNIGSTSHYKINWGGVRTLRSYRIEMQASNPFRGICVQPNSQLFAAAADGLPFVYFGDSYQGTISTYALPNVSDNLANQIPRRAGLTRTQNKGIGGTGYIQGKAIDDKNVVSLGYTFRANMVNNPPTALFAKAAAVAIAYGINDTSYTPSVVAAQALSDWAFCRTLYPNAVICVIGPWAAAGGPSAATLALDTALAAAFTTWGDANSRYGSPSQAVGGAWVSGTGRLGTITGTGNSDWATGADLAHPTVPGCNLLVGRVVSDVVEPAFTRASL